MLFGFLTADALEKEGFQSPVVGCPRHGGNAVIVRYDDGPDLASPGVADQIAQIVWSNELGRFDMLVIESRGTTAVFAYADLAERLGPPPYDTQISVESVCNRSFRSPHIDKDIDGVAIFFILGFLLMAGAVVIAGLLWISVVLPPMVAERWRKRRGRQPQ